MTKGFDVWPCTVSKALEAGIKLPMTMHHDGKHCYTTASATSMKNHSLEVQYQSCHLNPFFSIIPNPLRSLQRLRHAPLHVIHAFEPETNPHQIALDAERLAPVQLAVVRQYHERAREREVRAQARALVHGQGVEEGDGLRGGVEG